MKFIWSYFSCIILGFLVLLTYRIQNPNSTNFIKEGGFVENMTALFFFLSFLAALIAIFRNKEKIFPTLVSLAGFATFGDELEWGRKIFHYKALLYVGKKRIDSLHDFMDPIYKFLKTNFNKWTVIIAAIILTSTTIFILIKKNKTAFLSFLFSKKTFFMGAIAIFFAFSFILDHKLIVIPDERLLHSDILEECFEFAGAVTLFFLSMVVFLDEPKKEKTLSENK